MRLGLSEMNVSNCHEKRPDHFITKIYVGYLDYAFKMGENFKEHLKLLSEDFILLRNVLLTAMFTKCYFLGRNLSILLLRLHFCIILTTKYLNLGLVKRKLRGTFLCPLRISKTAENVLGIVAWLSYFILRFLNYMSKCIFVFNEENNSEISFVNGGCYSAVIEEYCDANFIGVNAVLARMCRHIEFTWRILDAAERNFILQKRRVYCFLGIGWISVILKWIGSEVYVLSFVVDEADEFERFTFAFGKVKFNVWWIQR